MTHFENTILAALLMLPGVACNSASSTVHDAVTDGNSTKDTDTVTDDVGDLSESAACLAQEKKLPPARNIVRGKSSPQIYISSGQQLAVGAVMSTLAGDWTNICTATVIAPKVVLTAAHCVVYENDASRAMPASNFRFAVGTDVAYGNGHREFAVKEVKLNSKFYSDEENVSAHDQAIFIMEDDLTVAVPGLVPIEINFDSDLDWMAWSEKVQNVGYGATGENCKKQNNTKRYWTTEPIVEMFKTHFTVDGDGYTGIGPGDSGGPALYRQDDGILRILGTVSHGDDSCVDIDEYSRIDDNLSFVKSAAGKIWGCLDLTEAGECTDENRVARWCADAKNDKITSENCEEKGQVCAIRDGVAACIDKAAEPPDNCNGLNWEGRCDGDTAVWCEDNVIKSRDCGSCGQSCGDTVSMGAYCL